MADSLLNVLSAGGNKERNRDCAVVNGVVNEPCIAGDVERLDFD